MTSEADFQREVIWLARRRHLLVHHCHDSRAAIGRGFPDLVLAGAGGLIFAELKANGGTLTPDQRHWGHVLEKGGGRFEVWRPRDLPGGAVEEALSSISRWEQLSI